MSRHDNPGDTPGKKVVPVSASAFSFSLNTSASKKHKLASELETPSLPRILSDNAGPSKAQKLDVQAQDTPRKRVLKPLESLSIPNAYRFASTPVPLTPRQRISCVVDETSPLRLIGKHKYKEEESKEGKVLRPVGDLTNEILVDQVGKRTTQVKDEHEGIGVSPGKRQSGFKRSNRGPLLATLQLQRLLHSHAASTLLFYVSTHRALSGPVALQRKPKRIQSRPTVEDHILTAPLVLRILDTIPAVAHTGVLAHCRILEQPPALRSVFECVDADESAMTTETIAVLFEPPPAEAPRLGIDCRLLSNRIEGDRHLNAGVWGPWSEIELPARIENDFCQVARTRRAMFASRYLIAEAPS